MKIFEGDPDLNEIIHLGTELENVESLIPNELAAAIADVKRRALDALQKTPECDYQQPPWLKKLLPIQG